MALADATRPSQCRAACFADASCLAYDLFPTRLLGPCVLHSASDSLSAITPSPGNQHHIKVCEGAAPFDQANLGEIC